MGILWVIPVVGGSSVCDLYGIVWGSMEEQCGVCIHAKYW